MSDCKQHLDIALDEIVPEYDSSARIVRWLFHKRLQIAADYVDQIQPKVLLDVGCGNGVFLGLINHYGIELYGIDLNPKVVQLSETIGNCNFSHRDLNHTDFRDEQFDAVVCLDTLEHLQQIDIALTELRRIMQVGGHLITSEPVESVLYKSLRFLIKGTYSQESGPGAGVHYHNARQVDRAVRGMGFSRVESKRLPVPAPFDLFHINLYRKNVVGFT